MRGGGCGWELWRVFVRLGEEEGVGDKGRFDSRC